MLRLRRIAQPLPVALDLFDLYEQILRRHLALLPRPGTSLKDLVERSNAIRSKQMECGRLEARLQQEIQFDRKVKLNPELRTLKAELNSLMGLKEEKELDASWTI